MGKVGPVRKPKSSKEEALDPTKSPGTMLFLERQEEVKKIDKEYERQKKSARKGKKKKPKKQIIQEHGLTNKMYYR